MPTLAIDHNILYYYDDVKTIEFTTSYKQYNDEKSLVLDMDCQWIIGDETYPLLTISRKEITSDTEIVNTIYGCISLVNVSSDFATSPFEQSVVQQYAREMITLYGMNHA